MAMLVGDVGERRRALVGGDHEIGIVAVVAHDVRRRDDTAVPVPILSVMSSSVEMKSL